MNRRKRAKENLMWRRKHDYALPNKNAASTVWLKGTRAVNGVAFGVYTARPNGSHMNYAIRLCDAVKDREDTKRYVEAYRRYFTELRRWQQARAEVIEVHDGKR